MKISTIKKFLLSLVILAGFLTVFFGFNGTRANAESGGVLLPTKDFEYYSLSSPLNVYCDSEVVAVAESNRLIVFYNGEVKTVSDRTSLSQVQRYKNGDLIFSDNGHIYLYTLNSGEVKEAGGIIAEGIGGSYFDYNGTYLITAYSTQMQIYGDNLPQMTISGIQSLTPVAVNATTVFYVKNNRICSNLLTDILSEPETYSEVTPSAMIANQDYVYYIKEGEIHRISLSNKQDDRLYTEETPFDLGKITEPEGLSFNGENLLIADKGGNCVEEFSVEQNILKFTGFAIADGKTAYNRLNGINSVEKFGNVFAAMDENKLSLINVGEGFDGYDEKYFENLFIGNVPDYFALGQSSLIYSLHNTVFALNLGGTSTELTHISTVRDICYAGGKFYVLANDGANTTVLSVSEKDFSFTESKIYGVTANAVFTDYVNNIYFADDLNLYKNESGEIFCARGLCEDFRFDLAGNLFALNNGKIVRFDGNAFVEAFSSDNGNITSFAMALDKKRVFYSVYGSNFVYETEFVGNAALDTAVKGTDFADGTTAKDIKLYSVKEGYPVYSVLFDNQFNLSGFADTKNEYAFIGEVTAVSDYDSATFFALAENAGVVLVPAVAAEELSVEKRATFQTLFVTTKASAYYIPVITKIDTFTLKTEEDAPLRLPKDTKVNAEYYFTALNVNFVYANTKINGETVYFYLPADFTAENRYEDLEFEKYSLEKIKACTVYENAELSDVLETLTETTAVRLIKNEGGALYIAYKTQDGYKTGYIAAKNLIDEPNTVVRNVLAILALITCLCGTVTYFVLRKKDK